MLFEFEDDSYRSLKKTSGDSYDVGLAIALSNSMRRIPGEQILSPAEAQRLVAEKLEIILE